MKFSPLASTFIGVVALAHKLHGTAASDTGNRIRGNTGTDRRLKVLDEDCQVAIADIQGTPEHLQVACETASGEMYDVEGLSADFVEGKVKNGELRTGDKLLGLKGKPIHANGKVKSDNPAPGIEKKNESTERKLAIVEGDRTVLAVMVTTAGDNKSYTQTRAKLEDDVFLDGVSLSTQYLACSHNKLNFVKATDRSGSGASIINGIVEITVPNSSTETDSAVRPAVTAALNSAFGVSSPTSLANHVMYCLPPGTMSGIAYAYINSWNSVYSDVWCNYVSAQLHEIGHNLNLAHSNEGTQTYGDQSGMMGYSYSQDDGPVMCFNNAKNFQLGWFDDATRVVSNPGSYNGPLKGQVNYSPGGDPVVIKINDPGSSTDYYVGFNHKVKHNSGTVEGGNQVTIQRAGEGNSYVASVLVAKLSAGGYWTVNLSDNTQVEVTVLSIDIASDTGKAQVDIRVGGCTINADCSDGNLCTDDICNAGVCENPAITCPGGTLCDIATCDPAVGCTGTTPKCDDADLCTVDSCDALTGQCLNDAIIPCCGDGTCSPGENCSSCAGDCPSFNFGGAICGNGICEDGETCLNCANDCNGVTGGNPNNRYCCSATASGVAYEVGCGDNRCGSCSSDPMELSTSCCGDGICEGPENNAICNTADCDPGATPSPTPPPTPFPTNPTPNCAGKNASCGNNSDCCSGNCKNNGRCA